MTKAVFTISASSAYDDQPEIKYHFPRRYLQQAKQAEGDWIVYYEPRRTTGPFSTARRQAYFAAARVARIESDAKRNEHYYAYVDNYIEFDNPVPFREGDIYLESGLRKADGSPNKGAFGWSIRTIPDSEFALILRAGFAHAPDLRGKVADEDEAVPEYEIRPIIQQIVSRKFRDRAFMRNVRRAYRNTCAISRLCLTNGGGRPEVQAAHIRPVEMDGPDTVRNGIALTGTLHWMFDRGLISVDDNYRVLLSTTDFPRPISHLLSNSDRLWLPDRAELRPHPVYLRWHRDNRFKG